jgi:hypothetical protein
VLVVALMRSRRLPFGCLVVVGLAVVADEMLKRYAGDFTERPAALTAIGFRLPAQVRRYSNGDRW